MLVSGECMPEQVDSGRILLSTMEAAHVANLSLRYIQRLLQEKRIEGVRIGTVWLVYKDSLTTFVTQPRKRGPKGPHNKSTQNHQSHPSNAKHAERV